MPQNDKTVASGRFRDARAALALTPAILALVLALFGLGLGITERPRTLQSTLGLMTAGGAFGLLAGLLASSFIAALLLAAPARVRYCIRGTTIVVKRGRREIRSIDALDCTSLRGTGEVTTRKLLVDVGVFWMIFDDYPCIQYTQPTSDGGEKIMKLPRVLIFGSANTQKSWALAREELIAAGVEPRIWETDSVR